MNGYDVGTAPGEVAQELQPQAHDRRKEESGFREVALDLRTPLPCVRRSREEKVELLTAFFRWKDWMCEEDPDKYKPISELSQYELNAAIKFYGLNQTRMDQIPVPNSLF